MRISVISALAVAATLMAASVMLVGGTAVGGAGSLALDDLSTSKTGSFPRRWRTWPMQRGDAAKVYRVVDEDGRKFIRAHDEWDLSEQIFLNFDWNVKARPRLSWQWRATRLPAGGDESRDAANDSACALYVVVGRYKGHAIKYVWSTTLPAGRVVSRRDGKLKVKVLDSGGAGVWRSHTVDVLKDYRDLFGSDLEKNPSGIGILTDGNATHSPSACDYADFAISKEAG
ncbi:MAG: DUF3047 domain-containing protein [Proteobacteria bacterium]|nr:DUF3047 domain-containing protein [Pseudomonadota bacterium]